MAKIILVYKTNIENEIFISGKGLAKARQFSIIHENEKTFGTATAHTATAPGTGDHKQFTYFSLEMNIYKSKPFKNAQKYPHGPSSGPKRAHGRLKDIFRKTKCFF